MPLLQVKNLTKKYPVRGGFFRRSRFLFRAVDDVSFQVEEGETLGLVGESGCGKTTTARCIIRLIEPTSGQVFFRGKDFLALKGKELRAMRREIQMIFQDPYSSLNPRMTVGSIIEEPLVIHSMGNRKERMERVAELLKMVGLEPTFVKRYPHEFSGGQRQRIGIARALALNPAMIIADEPVSALDVSIQAQIINLLKELQEKLHLTFLFIAHDLSVVQYFSDRVAVMYLGRLVEMASTSHLFRTPLHPYTKILLASAPIPDPKLRKKRDLLKGDPITFREQQIGCPFQSRCPVAVERCKSDDPPLREVQSGHFVACHLVE